MSLPMQHFVSLSDPVVCTGGRQKQERELGGTEKPRKVEVMIDRVARLEQDLREGRKPASSQSTRASQTARGPARQVETATLEGRLKQGAQR